jgi:hypothetical protein
MLEASMSAGGREVAKASAWRVLRTTAEPVGAGAIAPQQLPDTLVPPPPAGWVDGYLSAIEWRQVYGSFSEPGPAEVWGRMRYPLVPDEEPSPLTRVLAIADSGNGASWEVDINRWHFINPEVTVHLHRQAEGEWICLDAHTAISTGGAGLATSVLSDLHGPVGVGAQSLLVAPRPVGLPAVSRVFVTGSADGLGLAAAPDPAGSQPRRLLRSALRGLRDLLPLSPRG